MNKKITIAAGTIAIAGGLIFLGSPLAMQKAADSATVPSNISTPSGTFSVTPEPPAFSAAQSNAPTQTAPAPSNSNTPADTSTPDSTNQPAPADTQQQPQPAAPTIVSRAYTCQKAANGEDQQYEVDTYSDGSTTTTAVGPLEADCVSTSN